MPVSFQTFTHFSEAVVAFVAVNPDNQLTFFNFARAEAENIIVVSADSARMRAPVLIFIYPSFLVLYSWIHFGGLTMMSFLFNNPFPSSRVYAPPAGCVISIAKRPYCVPEHRKAPNFVASITKSRSARHPRGESQSLILPSPPHKSRGWRICLRNECRIVDPS